MRPILLLYYIHYIQLSQVIYCNILNIKLAGKKSEKRNLCIISTSNESHCYTIPYNICISFRFIVGACLKTPLFLLIFTPRLIHVKPRVVSFGF